MPIDKSIPISIAVEGPSDEIVVHSILAYLGVTPGTFYGLTGKDDLLKRLGNYNLAARRSPWLVLIDLDHSADCAPSYLREVLPDLEEGLILRFPVRAIEAWLLADAERIASYLAISEALIPLNPDSENNPKDTLVNLARRSPKASVRADIAPRPGSHKSVGPGYVSAVLDFVTSPTAGWRPEVAAQRSDSCGGSHCLNHSRSH